MSRRKPKLAISQFRLKNFKAVRDSGAVKFTPLTVFIGNNGVGKSSLIEGLETYRSIAIDRVDAAMGAWKGFEYVLNRSAGRRILKASDGREYISGTIDFELSGYNHVALVGVTTSDTYKVSTRIASDPSGDEIFVLAESQVLYLAGKPVETYPDPNYGRSPVGQSLEDQNLHPFMRGITNLTSMRNYPFGSTTYILSPQTSISSQIASLRAWQFVRLAPEIMGEPRPKSRSGQTVGLRSDGANIAEYLEEIRSKDSTILDGIIDTIRTLLPYAVDIQPVITSEIGRSVHLQLTEQKYKVPGWLLSTGTLRLVALLALFRHPNPPPLIVIEEIENGLDPRTIGLIIEEIRNVVTSGRSQVIVTTHSPYLLDMVPLSSVIYVERENGEPKFFRPGDDPRTQRWNESFTPGKLYTMGTLGRVNQ